MNQAQRSAASPAAQRRPKIRKSNEEKAASEQEHLSLVLTAAQSAIEILRQHNLPAGMQKLHILVLSR
jgi:hypothetical protein